MTASPAPNVLPECPHTRLSFLCEGGHQLTEKEAGALVKGLMKEIHRNPDFLQKVLVESLTLLPKMMDVAPDATSVLANGLMTATRKMPQFSETFDVCVGVAGHLATVNGHAALRFFQNLMIEAGKDSERKGLVAEQAMASLPQMVVRFPQQAAAVSDCMLEHIRPVTDPARYQKVMQTGISAIQPLAQVDPLSASNLVMNLLFFAKADWQLTGQIIQQTALALPEFSENQQTLSKVLSKVEEKITQKTRLDTSFVEPALTVMPRVVARSGLSANKVLLAMLRVAQNNDVLRESVLACAVENLYDIAQSSPRHAVLTAFNMLSTAGAAKEDVCSHGFVCQEFMIVKKRRSDADSAVVFCGAGEPVLHYAGFSGGFSQWDAQQAARFPGCSSADIEASTPLLHAARELIRSGQARPVFKSAVKNFKPNAA